MPTGYTRVLLERDVTFREFALRCTRAFGAMVEFRDTPMDEIVTQLPEPSKYHEEALVKAQDELKSWNAMTDSGKQQWAERKAASNIVEAQNSLENIVAENNKFRAMLAQVVEWNAPTEDHKEFKDFMLQQLRTSVDSEEYYEERVRTARSRAFSDSITAHEANLEWSINYHTEHLAKDQERRKGKQAWIDAVVGIPRTSIREEK